MMILHDAIKTIQNEVFVFPKKKACLFFKKTKKSFFFLKKTTKETGGLFFFLKTRVFLNPALMWL